MLHKQSICRGLALLLLAVAVQCLSRRQTYNACCVLCSLFFFEVVGLGPVYVSTISLLMPLGISLLALILQSMTQW